jgi:iron complex outermembrane recepter protein
MFKPVLSSALVYSLLLPRSVLGFADEKKDLTSLSIQELMRIEVTSVSKRKEKLVSAPAAITVLTPEDFRRSGATTLAEVLRLVPGLSVANYTGNKWGISARGFNSRFANKMLVLVDGRTVYTPTFSGVYWDALDYPLGDIDRIEVIRGPGATMWGSNAVNGVIQIFTKHTRDTAGVTAAFTGGTNAQRMTDLRHGFSNGKAGLRLWARSTSRGANESLDSFDDQSRNRMVRGGFRFDYDRGERDRFLITGDLIGTSGFTRVLDRSLAPPFANGRMFLFNHSEGNLVSRWTHEHKNGAATQTQVYYDRYRRNEEILEARQTADFDLQHTFAQVGSHTLQAGLGYRHSWDNLPPSQPPWIRFNTNSRSDFLGSGFVQDEIALGESRWKLLLGTRIEKNNYTGFEIQPGIRANYEWTPTRAVWAAVSRSVRTPSRFEHDVNYVVNVQPVAPGLNGLVTVMGNPQFKAERVVSYSAGYREQLSAKTSVDVSVFANRLTGLRGIEFGQPIPGQFQSRPVLVIPLDVLNASNGYTYGGETTVRRQLTSAWQLTGSYSFLAADLHSNAAQTNPDDQLNAPRHTVILDSRFDLKHGFQADFFAYGASRFTGPQGNAFYRPIAGRLRTDVRIGKKLPRGFDLSIIGQNLTNPRRVEGIPEANEIGTYQRRSVLVRLEYRFSSAQ